MRHTTCALVLLVALCAAASAQSVPSLTSLAPAIGRGYDIVTERVKAPFTQWTFYDGHTMMWNGVEYAGKFSLPLFPLHIINICFPRSNLLPCHIL
jgi:hypothetical protein